jgi:hypothetical protein
MENYYDVLIEDLYASLIIVEHRDVYRFVTCNEKYIPREIIQGDNVEYITCYDILHKSVLTLPLLEIFRHYHNDLNNLNSNDDVLLERSEILNKKINTWIESHGSISYKDFYNSYIRTRLIDINDVENCTILDFICDTDFSLSYDDITSPVVQEHRKPQIIKICQSLVDERLDEILSELDTLKTQCGNADDIEDIDTIIQMYHDSRNEVNYSNCVSLVDYFKTFPPLLLPLPEKLDNFIDELSKINVNNELLDFMSIVDNSLTYSEIQELLDELNNLQPEYKMESNQKDLTPFKKYLSNKLNNEHKQS